MKIILINPPRLNGNPMVREMRCAGLSTVSVYPPIELAYLAGQLRKKAEIKIIDANGENLSFEDIRKEIKSINPDVVVFTTSPTSFSYDAKIAKIAKVTNKKIKTILLDSHIAPVMPEKIKKSFPDIDNLIAVHPLFSIPKLLGLEGVANIEEHPLPAYDLLPLNKYSSMSFSRKKPFTTLITSVGCPNSCNFCVIGGATVERGYGKKWQFKSAKKVLEEIKYLLSLGVKSIFFFDETFTASRQRIIELCSMIEKERLKFEWSCNGRVDTLNEETIKAMKKAGCWNILFGIESGSELLLEGANKGTGIEKAKEAVMACKKNGIYVSASFIIGFPNETKETIKETLEIAKEIAPYRAQFVILTPYPGTKLYDQIKEKGLLLKDYSFEGYDSYCVDNEPAIKTEKLTAKELISAQQYIYRKFYLRPSFLLNTILSIKSFDQLANIIKSIKYLK